MGVGIERVVDPNGATGLGDLIVQMKYVHGYACIEAFFRGWD